MAPFAPADHRYTVSPADYPVFEGRVVHPVCSTYALAREFEWAGRRVYLAGRADGTEALGTMATVEHRSPAFAGEVLSITATPVSYERGHLIVDCEARVGERLIATGRTGQKVTSVEKAAALFTPPTQSL